MTAVEHAEVRGHSECANILHNYGLRRPSSALSVMSQVMNINFNSLSQTYLFVVCVNQRGSEWIVVLCHQLILLGMVIACLVTAIVINVDRNNCHK